MRIYRLSLGPWSWDFTVPESIDLPDIADRIRGFFGMLLILAVAAYLSDNRQAISRRVVLWGLGLQWGFARSGAARAGWYRVLEHAGDGGKGSPRLRTRRGRRLFSAVRLSIRAGLRDLCSRFAYYPR